MLSNLFWKVEEGTESMKDTTILEQVANSVRSLSIDAIQKANSGHPGLPMGCAELGALLYGEIVHHYPLDTKWSGRDRVVLSAGHGSMWLYSLLHLSGYRLPLSEIENFRQLHSKTPGHPEVGYTEGVEVTTGPLGQGLAMSVGLAMGQTRLAAYFGQGSHNPLFENYTYVLAGDGCMMEGVSSEACSLAGHLQLSRLIVFYDSNNISIDGNTEITFTENVGKRFEAYGWQVQYVDGHNIEELREAIHQAKQESVKPSLIIMKTVIGKGAPNKQGTHAVHGAPLGEDEIRLVKEGMGFPVDKKFYVPEEVRTFMAKRLEEHKAEYDKWKKEFEGWSSKHPELRKEWDALWAGKMPAIKWSPLEGLADTMATRATNNLLMQDIAKATPNFLGGSADLASSNLTDIKGDAIYSAGNRLGRNIRFGVREFGMGAIANGLGLYAPWRTYGATFFVFSDYMRPAIRLSAIQKVPTVWLFTHDTFHVGEDGPTHQAVEHMNSLRLMPNLYVARPADIEENQLAWDMALKSETTPYAFLLSRQNLPTKLAKPEGWREQAKHGAYVVHAVADPQITVLTSGGDTCIAIEAALQATVPTQVISVWCKDLWDTHMDLQKSMIKGKVVVFESGSHNAFIADDWVDLSTFGESGKPFDVAKALGMTAENLLKHLKK
jgi:transketolase